MYMYTVRASSRPVSWSAHFTLWCSLYCMHKLQIESEFESRWGQECSLLHVFQTGFEAHPASYPVCTWASFLRGIKLSEREAHQLVPISRKRRSLSRHSLIAVVTFWDGISIFRKNANAETCDCSWTNPMCKSMARVCEPTWALGVWFGSLRCGPVHSMRNIGTFTKMKVMWGPGPSSARGALHSALWQWGGWWDHPPPFWRSYWFGWVRHPLLFPTRVRLG
jgi:hypothetical protein